MAREIAEIPRLAGRMASARAQSGFTAAAELLRDRSPDVLLTLARGSSAHACAWLAHAAGRLLGLPVAPVELSLATVYGATLAGRGAAVIAVSQSGSSADLCANARMLAGRGTPVLVVTNAPGSALAKAGDQVVDIAAGPELAVAATKSFFGSVLAGLWVLAHWSGDEDLRQALSALPDALERQHAEVSEPLRSALLQSDRVVVIGRGPGLGLAREIALKLQELCGVHASAFSAAEVLHGPRAMLTADTPVIVLRRGAGDGLSQAIADLAAQPVPLHFVGDRETVLHPLVDPMLDLVPIYTALEAAARDRGRDPDAPAFLRKETITL